MAIPPLPKKLYKTVPEALDAIKRSKQRLLRLYKVVVSEDLVKGTFGYAVSKTNDGAQSTFCDVMGISAEHIPITSKKAVTLTMLRSMVTHLEEMKLSSTSKELRDSLQLEIEKLKAQILERTPAAARSLIPEGQPDLATTPATPVTPVKAKKKKKSVKAAPAAPPAPAPAETPAPPAPIAENSAPAPPAPAPIAESPAAPPAVPPAPVQVPNQQPPETTAPRPVPVPVVPPMPQE